MREIVEILMRRDDLTENEAWNLVEECQEEIFYAIDNGESITEIENIIADYLGLEPDYIMYFI